MANVTIFGTGNMGSAIADVLTAGGSKVDHIGHADPPGLVDGDIVILAVYYAALKANSRKVCRQVRWQDRRRHHKSGKSRDL